MEKYKLTKETRVLSNTTLFRIKALRSFSNITEGELGGWIEKERIYRIHHTGQTEKFKTEIPLNRTG